MDDGPPLFPDVDRQQPADVAVAPEDEVVGLEIEDGVENPGEADVPLEGRIKFEASPDDMVLVNGVELIPDSMLRALKAGLHVLQFEHIRVQSHMLHTIFEIIRTAWSWR